MELRDENNQAIAGGAEHWISGYTSKVPEFVHATAKTLGGETSEWRFGSEEYHVSFRVLTESKLFYETLISYHKNGTKFRLNSTKDLGNLMLKTRAGACNFKRLELSASNIIYEINLDCFLLEEGIT